MDLKGFWPPSGKARQNLKTFPQRSSHNFQLLQVPWMSPGNVISSAWGWLVALSWAFPPPYSEFWGLVIISLMHWKTLLSGLCWFLPERIEYVPSRSQRNPWAWQFLQVLHASSGCSFHSSVRPSCFLCFLPFFPFLLLVFSPSCVLQYCKSSEISLCLPNNVTMETNGVSWENLMSRYLNLFNWRNLLIW